MKICSLYTNACVTVLSTLLFFTANTNANEGRNDWRGGHHYSQGASKRNEQLVVEFYDKIFNQRLDVNAVSLQYLAEDYIQHNPNLVSGRQAFIDLFSKILPLTPNRISEIHRVITDGDLVTLHVHAYTPGDNDPGVAIVDIFRVANGKIVEHWDVIQPVPSQSANQNGMF